MLHPSPKLPEGDPTRWTVGCAPEPSEDWDRFVASQPGAALAHAGAWGRVLREAYGLPSAYLVARSSTGEPAGVLPLVTFRNLRGARELLSLPFLDGGGVLAADAGAERALLARALELARACGARGIELRQERPLASAAAPAAGSFARVDLRLPLAADEESQWSALGAKVRNQTRKAQREELSPALGRGPRELARFYAVYAANMRDLGSPPHALAFFEALARAFGERLCVVLAEHRGSALGGLIAIHHGERVYVPWASTLRAERSRCPNNLIYWEAIRWALARGAREFDFGRSPPDSGTYHWKRGWGAQEHPLAWLQLDPAGEPRPVQPLSESALLQRLSGLWSRLPLGLSTWLGGRLRRYLAN
jgi:FemAB-related protein (PEP-CTERM system-associated)